MRDIIVVFLVYLTLVGLALWATTALFAYNLACFLGKDVPWYADLAGGMAFNGLNLLIAIGCWIATLCGYQTPFINP